MRRPCNRPLPLSARKDRLPSIGIARPLVHRQDTRELAQVLHLGQLLFGQVVTTWPGIMPPAKRDPNCSPALTTHARPSQVDLQFRVFSTSQLETSTSSVSARSAPPPPQGARARNSLASTRVCCGLFWNLTRRYAVRAQHQLALRAAPHAPDLLHRQNANSVPRCFLILYRILMQCSVVRCQVQLFALASSL